MISSPPQERYPGRLIAVEGLDGSGKSTQIYLLKRWLEMKGLKVFFSEWNSSLLVKKALISKYRAGPTAVGRTSPRTRA